jgi:hypothetical protein
MSCMGPDSQEKRVEVEGLVGEMMVVVVVVDMIKDLKTV